MSEDFDWTRHLSEGEDVLWQGRPDQMWFIPTWMDLWALLFFGVIYTAFFPLLVRNWWNDGEWRALFILLAVPCIIMLIRIWFEPRSRRRQRYALTNRRALVTIVGAPHKMQQFHLHEGQHVWISGWRYAMLAFSQKTPGLFAKVEPFLRMDGPPMSPIGGGVRGAQMTFLVPDKPGQIVEIARQTIAQGSP